MPSFSPDSEHLIYRGQNEGKWALVIDNKEPQAWYEGVALQKFSSDSKHLLYLAQDKSGWFVVADGVEGKERVLGFLKGSYLLSPTITDQIKNISYKSRV